MMDKLHDIIFAYLSNLDLQEPTRHHNTCSVPYGSQYRVVNFMLSNVVNANVFDVGLIVHTNYQFLLDHIDSGKDWDLGRKHDNLHVLPPFDYSGRREGVYRGHMDILAGVHSYLQRIRQDYVMLVGDGLAVNLPLNDIFEAHTRNDADITAACTSHPMGSPKDCGCFTIDAGGRITDVLVHLPIAQGCESLEIYTLSRQLLLSLVDHCAAHNIPSFSTDMFQAMAGRLKICPYVFDGYAAHFQSVAGYFARSMELLNLKMRIDLSAPGRPVRTKDRSGPFTYYGLGLGAVNSLVADGCIIEGEVENSILFRGVRVERGAKVSGYVLMQDTAVRTGVALKCAITDRDVRVNPGRMLMGHSTYPSSIAKNEIV